MINVRHRSTYCIPRVANDTSDRGGRRRGRRRGRRVGKRDIHCNVSSLRQWRPKRRVRLHLYGGVVLVIKDGNIVLRVCQCLAGHRERAGDINVSCRVIDCRGRHTDLLSAKLILLLLHVFRDKEVCENNSNERDGARDEIRGEVWVAAPDAVSREGVGVFDCKARCKAANASAYRTTVRERERGNSDKLYLQCHQHRHIAI